MERDKRITWIITFYAAWSPQSVTFAPIFSEISSQYVLYIILPIVTKYSSMIALCMCFVIIWQMNLVLVCVRSFKTHIPFVHNPKVDLFRYFRIVIHNSKVLPHALQFLVKS